MDGPARAGIQGPRSEAAVPCLHLPSDSLLDAQLILLGLLLCVFTWDRSLEPDKAGKAGPFTLPASSWVELLAVEGRCLRARSPYKLAGSPLLYLPPAPPPSTCFKKFPNGFPLCGSVSSSRERAFEATPALTGHVQLGNVTVPLKIAVNNRWRVDALLKFLGEKTGFCFFCECPPHLVHSLGSLGADFRQLFAAQERQGE